MAPKILLALAGLCFLCYPSAAQEAALKLNDKEYFEMPGLNVMLASDFYPEGHQGGESLGQLCIVGLKDIRKGPRIHYRTFQKGLSI